MTDVPAGRPRRPRPEAVGAPRGAAALLAAAAAVAAAWTARPAEPTAGALGGGVPPAPVAAARGRTYLDGPPPGHTGGFGEPTCRACHFDRPLDPEPGEVRIEGAPHRFVPDSAYALTVVLEQPAMERAGFQLAARWAHGPRRGCSAGRLRGREPGIEAVTVRDSAAPSATSGAAAPPDRVAGGDAAAGPAPGAADAAGGCAVTYLQHTEAGTEPAAGGRARWRVRWVVPSAPAHEPVAFHVAANAANDDASEFGDRIYAAEATIRPPVGERPSPRRGR